MIMPLTMNIATTMMIIAVAIGEEDWASTGPLTLPRCARARLSLVRSARCEPKARLAKVAKQGGGSIDVQDL